MRGSSVFVGILSAVSTSRQAAGTGTADAVAGGFDMACLVAFVVDVLGVVTAVALARVEARKRGSASAQTGRTTGEPVIGGIAVATA